MSRATRDATTHVELPSASEFAARAKRAGFVDENGFTIEFQRGPNEPCCHATLRAASKVKARHRVKLGGDSVAVVFADAKGAHASLVELYKTSAGDPAAWFAAHIVLVALGFRDENQTKDGVAAK